MLDSGNRREFDTGAVRDIQEGKGRCDLLPLDIVGAILNDPVLVYIDDSPFSSFFLPAFKAVSAFYFYVSESFVCTHRRIPPVLSIR